MDPKDIRIAELEAEVARLEGIRTFPKIISAKVCYGQGWSDGYGSALKGRDGPCMDEAWLSNLVAQALDLEDSHATQAEAREKVLVEALEKIERMPQNTLSVFDAVRATKIARAALSNGKTDNGND